MTHSSITNTHNTGLTFPVKSSTTPMSLTDAIRYIENAYETIDRYVASDMEFEGTTLEDISVGDLLEEGARQRARVGRPQRRL